MSEELTVANEIVKLLHHCPEKELLPLTAAIGAKDFTGGKDFVQFKVKGDKGINKVVIRLNGLDLYDVEFWDIRMLRKEPWLIQEKKDEAKDIYTDKLVETVWRGVVHV